MEQYIGTKVINAESMNRRDYNDFRGWDMLDSEFGLDEGYLVEYEIVGGEKPNTEEYKGYITWSPKMAFDKAYRKTDGLNFGLATEAMKKGKRIARAGWNGEGIYAYYVPAASYDAQTDVARKEFGEKVPYRHYIALKTAQNDVATYTPNISDVLADDWMIV